MRKIDINTWERKQHFEHFNNMLDPYFAVTVAVDVTIAYNYAKQNGISFFGLYLHDCMRAINEIENLKIRILNEEVIVYDTIHASPTIMRSDKTFGFSFIEYTEDFNQFINNLNTEKDRIENSINLYPPQNSLDCIHCSAMPWINFSGHKEPISSIKDSVPKLAFGKMHQSNNKQLMNVAIAVNHALADGYHVAQFVERFQQYLNNKK